MSLGPFGGDLNPAEIETGWMADGRAFVKLKNSVVRVYTEEEVAEMTVAMIHQAHAEPEQVDERWYELLRKLVGDDRWNAACVIVAAVVGE